MSETDASETDASETDTRPESDGRIVRRKAWEIRKTSPEELARIDAIPDEAIDYSDIPQQTGERTRLFRDESGKFIR